MSAQARIFFVNRFYWPDEPATAQLLTDLAVALARAGHDVTIITSSPRQFNCPATETRNGVQILRTQSSRLGRRNLVGRALDFLSFSAKALRLLRAHVRSGDTVVVMTDPPLLGCAATSMAMKRGARVVHWVQDIYPEIATAVTGNRLPLLFRDWRNNAWRRSDHCVTPGTDMARFVSSCGVPADKIHSCPNWAPAGLAPVAEPSSSNLRSQWGFTGKFVVGYSGNLGRVHDLDPLLDIAESLRTEPDIAFVFIGDGAQKTSLQTGVTARQLTNVFFQPAQPRDNLRESLSLPDLHVVTLRSGCEQLVFPSKLYGIAAVGRPVLFIGPVQSEIATLVQSKGFGLAVGRDDPAKAAKAIRLLRSDINQQASLRKAAIQFWETEGRLEHAVRFWSPLLSRLKPLADSPITTPVSSE
jgi:glycosyltransferase involved in cell wall biosynthesis